MAASVRQAMNLQKLLPKGLYDALYQASKRVCYKDGQMIHGRGDATRALLMVEAGRVIAGNTGVDGSFIAAYRFEPGDVVGEFTLFAGLPRTHDFFAQGPTVIRYIDKPSFDRVFADEPSVALYFLQAITLRLHFTMEAFDDAMRLPVLVRAAKLLRNLSDRAGGACVVIIKQSELADTLGVSRVAIGAALKTLGAQGLIHQKRGQIEILDRAKFDHWITDKSVVPEIT